MHMRSKIADEGLGSAWTVHHFRGALGMASGRCVPRGALRHLWPPSVGATGLALYLCVVFCASQPLQDPELEMRWVGLIPLILLMTATAVTWEALWRREASGSGRQGMGCAGEVVVDSEDPVGLGEPSRGLFATGTGARAGKKGAGGDGVFRPGTARQRVISGGRRVAKAPGGGAAVTEVSGGGGGLSKMKKDRRTREEARQLFDLTDRDRNKTLDREEVRAAVKLKGLELGDAEFDKLFRTMDANKDGKIDFVEFERALVGLDEGGGRWELEEPMRRRLAEAFAQMDLDKDGVLEEGERCSTRGELARLLMELGMSPKALDKVGGGLSLEAFRRQVEREREITLKEQGLQAAEIGKAVAECVPGGCAENPLEGLEGMSEDELGRLCAESVLPAVRRALLGLRKGLQEQANRRRGAGGGAGLDSNPKFAVEQKGGGGMAQFGGLDDFHKGLDAIGLPNPRLREGMEAEHCRRGDSNKEFSPGNYDTRTTSAAEWGVVTDREKGEKASGGLRRVKWVEDIMREIQGDEVLQAAKLREEEVLALQLYTGPMFHKYNAVLRGFPKGTVEAMGGNEYTTTIYCIVSGIIKLSKVMKLPEDRKVYRGLGGLSLPQEFLRADKYGVRGGVEFAMMSTSVDRSVALQYAGSEVPCLFEIDVGACDRGASLSFLSQYPKEEEILLPPRSYLEVVEGVQRTEPGPDGRAVRVVKLKVNANVMSSTIEEIEGRRRGLFLSAAQNAVLEIKSKLSDLLLSPRVMEQLKHRPADADHGLHKRVGERTLREAEEWLEAYRGRDSAWFNEEGQYALAQRELTELETMALRKFECWIDGSSGLRTNDLKHEKMLLVSRRAEAGLTRRLHEGLSGAGGGGGGGEATPPAGLALELCKRRGLVIGGVDEPTGVLMEPALVACAARGDLWGLRLLLAAGCSVGAVAKDGSTALHRASMMGHLDCVEELLRCGAKVDAKDTHGRTCLYSASEMGHVRVIDHLVGVGGRGLCLEKTNEDKTCAHAAAQIGHVPSLRSLWEGGGEELLMAQDSKGRSTAHNAAFEGHLAALRFLVEQCGAKLLRLKKNDGTPCSYFAAQNDHLEVLRFLVREGGKDLILQVDDAGRSCAYAASQAGQLEVLKWLVEQGGKRLLVTELESSCAFVAYRYNHIDVVKYIVSVGGADLLQIVNSDGVSCAFLACQKGDFDLLKFMVQQVGKVRGRDLLKFSNGEGVSCAFLASERGDKDMLGFIADTAGREALLALDKDGHSCAHIASIHGHLDALRLIVERGGGRKLLTAADKLGQTCALTAAQFGHLEVLRYVVKAAGKEALTEADRDGNTCAIWASLTGRTEMLRYILEAGGTPQLLRVRNDGRSCAFAASLGGHLETLRFLGEQGGQPLMMLKTKDGMSCAAIAKQKKHGEVVEYLDREWNMAVEKGWSSRRRSSAASLPQNGASHTLPV